jgi:hypothetical protein
MLRGALFTGGALSKVSPKKVPGDHTQAADNQTIQSLKARNGRVCVLTNLLPIDDNLF